MPSSKEIRRRIKSVKNIAQITKAMELVAAAKMRKAQSQAISSRPYAQLSGALLKKLAAKSDLLSHPLIKRVMPEGKSMLAEKVLIVLITSDRGLAGALNTNVINKALNLISDVARPFMGEKNADKSASYNSELFDIITVGKKGANAARRNKLSIIAAFDGKDKGISILDAKPIAEIVIADYLAFKYEKVFIVYTDFISTLVQKPNILQILPFSSNGSLITDHGSDIVFEPDPDEVLERLITSTIEFAVYQCMVEAVASEHSARMLAMRNANDAAGELIDDLTLSGNLARQAGITRELSEISAAKLAME